MLHRTDLDDAAQSITTLFKIGVEMKEIERNGWSHWKNKEDYSRIYGLPHKHRYPMELIYSDGRSFCGDIGSYTNQFVYDHSGYPTVTKIVQTLDRYIERLNFDKTLTDALTARDLSNFHNNFAFESMCYQFERQMEIVANIKVVIKLLRGTDQYKRENGMPTSKNSGGITVHGSSNVNISSGSHNSQQTITVNDELAELVRQMIDAVKASSVPDQDAMVTAIEELKDTKPSPTSRYRTFIDKTKDHMTIFGPFIAPLTKLLLG